MLKIDKNCWVVYNKDGALATIEICNRDKKDSGKVKGYNEASILNAEYDNSDYVLLWSVWDNKTNMTIEQIKQNIDKKLSFKDYIRLKFKTSIFNRVADPFMVVGGQLLGRSHDEKAIDLVYGTICSHFDKSAKCWQYRGNPGGYTYCTREQAKQVLGTFEKMETKHSQRENGLKK